MYVWHITVWITLFVGQQLFKNDLTSIIFLFSFQRVMASGNRERRRMMSLKDDGTSDRSPGDTLPWNLSRYQKVRRSKSASAEVLDPAERAVIRIAGGLRFNVSLSFFFVSARLNRLTLLQLSNMTGIVLGTSIRLVWDIQQVIMQILNF